MNVDVTYKTTGGSILQVIMLGKQRDYLGEDGFAHQFSFLIFGNNTWSHLDLLANLKTQRGLVKRRWDIVF